jgi:hypothetical protein
MVSFLMAITTRFSPRHLPMVQGRILTYRQLSTAVGSEGASPIIRVPWNEEWMIKRALDAGAHGILTPMCMYRQRMVARAETLIFGHLGHSEVRQINSIDLRTQPRLTFRIARRSKNSPVLQIPTPRLTRLRSRVLTPRLPWPEDGSNLRGERERETTSHGADRIQSRC